MAFNRLDVGQHLTILSPKAHTVWSTFKLMDKKIIEEARGIIALIDDEKTEYDDNYLVNVKGSIYKISNEITAEVESITPETSKSLSHKNDCVVSHLSIKTQEGSKSPFFVTQLKVARDIPLLEDLIDKKNKCLMLDALYRNYQYSIKNLRKLFIYAANPQHAWQIILTFLFFEAYRYQDKIRDMWRKDSSVESAQILKESNEKIIADLKEKYKQPISDNQIRQAELNSVALYNYIKQDEKRDKTLNNWPFAHLCHLKAFEKIFAKDEKSHSVEQVKTSSASAADKIKKPAVIGFIQGLFSHRAVRKDKDEKREPSKWRCCFPNFYS